MAMMNRRGRYYNYPNLRTNTNTVNRSQSEEKNEIKLNQQDEMLHAMNEIQGIKADAATEMSELNTYENNQRVQEKQNQKRCRVRFLNAAAGYGDLKVTVAGEELSKKLEFGKETDYKEINEGYQLVNITMVEQPQAVLLNKNMPFQNCMYTTAAIINTATGIEIMMIPDIGCQPDKKEYACFRVVNLSYTSPALDVILENGNPIFEDVRFKQVTEYKRAVPGDYNFNVMLARTAEVLKNNTIDMITPEIPIEEGGYPGETEDAYAYFFEEFEQGKRYTAYMIGNKEYEPTFRVETLEDDMN